MERNASCPAWNFNDVWKLSNTEEGGGGHKFVWKMEHVAVSQS